jgi:hypothetical protein
MKEASEDKRQGCPICGKGLDTQVLNAESVGAELYYTDENICIAAQDVTDVDFDHTNNEEGFTEEPHPLTAVFRIGFDRSGKALFYKAQITGAENG